MSRSTALGALAAATLALAAPVAAAAPASAAEGGTRVGENPGVVALTDSEGSQLCSAVLVAPQWALTWNGPLTCANADMATGNSHDHVNVDKMVRPRNADPRKTQALLVHFDRPITSVKPAKLGTTPPKAGETLKVVAFNGPEGVNHLLSLGSAPLKVEGHNHWISWYAKQKSMRFQTGLDSGDPIMRGDEVVAFSLSATDRAIDAEDIANVSDWVKKTTAR